MHLEDQDKVTIRPIRPSDKALLATGHGRLSDESIYRRFLSPKPVLSGAELRYLTEVDGVDHVAFVAVRGTPEEIVGVGRFVRLREHPTTAEIAVVVGDELQGRGIGRAIGHELADAARARGVRRFSATVLGENLAARRLLRSISERLEQERPAGGVQELTAVLAA